MNYLKLVCCIIFPLLLSSCWIKVTETRGKVNTKNLVTFEEIRDNPEKYFGKEVSIKFKVMYDGNTSYGDDENCCALSLFPENYLGSIKNGNPKEYYDDLQKIKRSSFSNTDGDADKERYEYIQNNINDLKKTNLANVLNDLGVFTGYLNCPIPAQLYNKGFDSLASVNIIKKEEVINGNFYPSLSNGYVGGIATGILFEVNSTDLNDSVNTPKVEETINQKLYGTEIKIYLTGISFRKELF